MQVMHCFKRISNMEHVAKMQAGVGSNPSSNAQDDQQLNESPYCTYSGDALSGTYENMEHLAMMKAV